MGAKTIDAVYALGSIVVTLILWQAVVKLLGVPAYFIPAPSDVAVALGRGWSLYVTNFQVTLYTTLVAFAVAFIFAMVLGALVSEVTFIRRTVSPLLVAMQAMPRIALAPVFIVWFGFGPGSKIVIGAFAAFFPIFVNTVHGMMTVEPEQLALMRSFRASRVQIFWKIKLPNALPFLLAGANIGIIFAILGVIVGEFLGANQGMGYLIVNESSQMDTSGVFASVVILSGTGVVFHYGIAWLRHRLLFWAAEADI